SASPSFIEAMHDAKRNSSLTKLNLYQEIYDKKNYKIAEKASFPKIPKIIHQIWIGSPVPERFQELMDSWKTFHPDWTYILWDDASIKTLHIKNALLFSYCKTY